MNKPRKKYCDWCKSPWTYKQSLSIVILLIVVGTFLQLTIGNFDYNVIRFPANIFFLAGMLLFVVLMTFHSKKPFFQWLSSISLSVSTIGGLLICSLIMGIVPQITSDQSGNLAGFDCITRSWPFILVYLLTIINLSCVVSGRLLHFTWRDYAFYLNHVGLLVLLIAAGLSAADMQRFEMHVEEGTKECRVNDQDGSILELPITIQLNDFYMEEYIPKLAMTPPEPKLFRSDIVVFTKNGKMKPFMLEVNKPMRVGPWMIYQFGYDIQLGKASNYSSFELVYDPWLIFAYLGIFLIFIGSICLFWQGNKKKKHWLWILIYGLIVALVFVIINLLKPIFNTRNPMPALQSMWYVPHVTAYILSYFFMSTAAITAVILLCRYRKIDGSEPLMGFTDNLIFIGFGLYMTGLLMGAVWAKEAWGQYWSWDPKETWAFATAAAYLLYIHLRNREDKPKRFTLWLIIIGLIFLLITWKGVGYLPASTHSVHLY